MDVRRRHQETASTSGAEISDNGVESFIRGVGFVKSVEDIEKIVIRQEGGTPIAVRNVATVRSARLPPRLLDNAGMEAVGASSMRYGENPKAVMVGQAEDRPARAGLPSKTARGRPSPGRDRSFYDRSDIVRETLATLTEALARKCCWPVPWSSSSCHLRTAATVVSTLPLAVALTFILMNRFGVGSNIMSLAGLAIMIGDVADMGIIMSENIYRRIASATDEEKRGKGYFNLVYSGAAEVGGAIVTAVSNTIVSFLPVFFLTDQE